MRLLDEVKAGLKPSAAEEKALQADAASVLDRLNGELKGAKAVLGGSGAKGTWLRGEFDIDVFVRYDYRLFAASSAGLSDLLEPVLRKLFSGVKHFHGSRDYFQFRKGKCVFEVVPILAVRSAEQARNITDVSPLHAEWVRRKLGPQQKDDVRLLKAFCKAQGIYGAESHIRGFSGYVCEILMAKYGSFVKLLRAAAKWQGQVVVDVERQYATAAAALRELNRSKVGPLVVIDPVQKTRNAAAAVSEEVFVRFAKAARAFLKNPSGRFFVEKKVRAAELGKGAYAVAVQPLGGKPDVAGAKVLKVLEFLKAGMEKRGFAVQNAGWQWNEKGSLLWLDVPEKVSAVELRQGPELKRKEHVERFRKMHRQTFMRKGRVYARIPRQHVDAGKALAALLRESYVKERVRGAKVV